MFYCHFPDQLLATRESFIKSLYRKPLDWIEEYTTRLADRIVVNSQFTRKSEIFISAGISRLVRLLTLSIAF